MITIRKAGERGGADYGWLQTAYTFSFNTYHDPAHMGFRALRVMNEDVIAGGGGFGEHGHRDMEIVTYVLSGVVAHRDSMGHASALSAGEFQRMTAGRGVRHSEMNASADEPVHLYQIWLLPERPGLEPGYEQKAFPPEARRGAWQVVASPDGRDGSLRIHQDASILLADLDADAALSRPIGPGRHAWLQVLRGSVELEGKALEAGDGAAISDEPSLALRALGPAEVMLFDLA